MKWSSTLLAAALLAGSAQAGDGADLLRTPPRAAPLAGDPVHERRAIEPGRFALTAGESRALLSAVRDAVLRLPSVDAYLGTADRPLAFRRYEPFARGARIHRVSAQGVIEVEPQRRHFFLGAGPDAGVGMALDPASGAITGFATRGESRVELAGFAGIGIEVIATAEPAEAVNECGTVLGDQPPEALAALAEGAPVSRSEAPQGAALSFQAVIAVDTDTEWMAGKNNDTATAMTWITDAFLAMNVFYERDVETRLLIGDVLLRVGSDPYSVPSNRLDQLSEFGEHWRTTMQAVDRDFATLFSGRGIAVNSFSGIAWVNQYCNGGQKDFLDRTVGSYSLNAIGTGRTVANTALFVGHEIGHNMGSPHTHCYSPPVDQCYNAESGCFSGTPACPAGGKGTVMSYCHYLAPQGAGCGTSNSEFHPTVQALLESRLASNSPGCIAPFVPPLDDLILSDGFESP